jgi:hypothetical protein
MGVSGLMERRLSDGVHLTVAGPRRICTGFLQLSPLVEHSL